jgi:hypothetical protein
MRVRKTLLRKRRVRPGAPDLLMDLAGQDLQPDWNAGHSDA